MDRTRCQERKNTTVSFNFTAPLLTQDRPKIVHSSLEKGWSVYA